jgi:hypothetical protein
MKLGIAIYVPTSLMWAGFCGAQDSAPPREPIYRFGTTVVASTGFKGEIYHIPKETNMLPEFEQLKPVGVIYAKALNVPPTLFTEGFPGVTSRVEWFAIDYNGRFWIEKSGKYRFSLTSDDGSRLYIDGREVIENDGIHPYIAREGNVKLKRGAHNIRVPYFQGPGGGIALILKVAGPKGHWRIFNMDEFSPPASP